MTDKEKAKAYDNALDWMRSVYPTMTGAFKEDAEHYFPGLKESEDERVRKWLIEMVEEVRKANPTNAEHNGNCSDAIAWLEKQGGQKPTDNVYEKDKTLAQKLAEWE